MSGVVGWFAWRRDLFYGIGAVCGAFAGAWLGWWGMLVAASFFVSAGISGIYEFGRSRSAAGQAQP